MTFSDQPEYRVLPQSGGPAAVECAVYPPRLSGNAGARPGLVVHLYGHSGSCRDYNLMRPAYATVRRRLWENGYWLVVPDLGGSHWMNDAARRSLDAILDGLVRDQNVDPARLHLFGTSMGGGSSLAYAMRRPGRFRSLCAIFPMTDFGQWMKEQPHYLPGIAQAHGVSPADAGAVLEALSPLRQAAAFAGTPVFLLHGDADTVVPVHHSRDFAAALRKQGVPVTFREAPGVGHDDVIAEPFQEEIVAFLAAQAGA